MKLPLTRTEELWEEQGWGRKSEAPFGHIKFEVPVRLPDTYLGCEPTPGVGPGWSYVGSQQHMRDL